MTVKSGRMEPSVCPTVASLPAGCPRSGAFRPSTSLGTTLSRSKGREVLCQKQPALPRTHHVEIAVAIDVDDRNLHPAAHTPAEINQVSDPFHLSGVAARHGTVFIPVDSERLTFAGIRSVVRHEALARDQIQAAIAVDIDERRRVSLRPCIVDDPLRPLAVGTLLEPEDAEVMTRCGHDVVPAVAVDVEYVEEAELGDAGRRGGIRGCRGATRWFARGDRNVH